MPSLSIVTLATSLAAMVSLPPQPGEIRAHGVLREIGPLCQGFETDEGALYVLEDTGRLTEGDRVFVVGTATTFAACGNLVLPRLSGTVEPAFAGLGTVRLKGSVASLEADGGGTYVLEDPAGLPDGAHAFVQGVVRGRRIEEAFVGPAFEAFGRVFPTPTGWTLEGEDGDVALARLGLFDPVPGDWVYVEGSLSPRTVSSGSSALRIAGGTTSVPLGRLPRRPLVRRNTTRRAHELVGRLLDDGSGGLLFEADGLIFDDVFRLEDYGGFRAGDQVFVRGRRLEDYDPLEPRTSGPLGLIRDSRIDPGYQACGNLTAVSGAGGTFQSLAGETLQVPYAGGQLPGPLVYVAGALAPSGSAALSHSLILPCVELPGTLEQGFECTPLFVADFSVGPAGDVFVLENLGGKTIGEHFCVMGAISACASSCPFPCIVANTVDDCTQ